MRCQSGVRTSEQRDHRYSDGAVPVRVDRHAVGTHEHGWLTVREFVILFPDPIAFAPGRANFCDICQHTSSRSLFAGHWPVSVLPPAKRRARLNTCRSRPVSARCTRCRCYNVFVLVLLSHHKSIGDRLLLLPQAGGLALCHLSRQDTSRGVPSQGRHRSKVCACVHVFVLASHSHHKTSRLWTLAQDIILEWEQREKRRVGGGAPCESCKTVFCVPIPVASDSCHDQASAWLLGDVAETDKSSSVAGRSLGRT